MQPLEPELNDAILRIVNCIFPKGIEVSDSAPNTYEALCARLDAGRTMCVWSGASECTIYADARVNYAFRAWHDWCHWKGRFPFTSSGERAACAMQMAGLRAWYGPSLKVVRWCSIIHAEVVGQQEYFSKFWNFPEDQCGFVRKYVKDMSSRWPASTEGHSRFARLNAMQW